MCKLRRRFCWITSTYTLPKHYEGTEFTGNKLNHGVGTAEEGDEKVYHAYYQWVPFLLALQGIMFYFPHWLWKQLEGGRMRVRMFLLSLSFSFALTFFSFFPVLS